MRTGKRYIKVEDRRKDLYKIKQVAEMLQTTPRTIRYYEQRGILPPVKRTHGKMRLYTKTDVDILRKARELQAAGASLEEIKAELVKVQQNALVSRDANKIKIVVDSTASIPFDLARQNNIEIIPLHIKFGHADLLDGLDITAAESMKREKEGRLAPSSSPPTEEEFIGIYTRLYEAGAQEIISIHLSEKISDTVAIARKAASFIKDFKVTVIDSGSYGPGVALLAFAAAASISAETPIEVILQELAELRKNISEILVLNEPSRVMGKEKNNALLGLLLSFKPVLQVQDGILTLRTRVKNIQEAEEQMVRFCREKGTPSHIIITHANMPEAAQELMQRIEKLFTGAPSIIFQSSVVPVANLSSELLGIAIC